MVERQNAQPASGSQAPAEPQTPFDPVDFLQAQGLLPTGSAVRSKLLTGGYLNHVYRVTGGFGDWVVKRFRRQFDLALFPNLADMEARALALLGPHDIAPRSIGFYPDAAGDVLVYEFYGGRSWPGAAAVPDVGAVAGLLRRLHALTVNGFREGPIAPSAILAQGEEYLIVPADRLAFDALRPELIEMPLLPRRSLLHTDTGPGNLILGDGGLRLIDWQCPALGDPAEDLCAFLSPAFQILYDCPPLQALQRRDFLAAYGDTETIRRFHLLEPFFHWRMATYCAMRRHQYRETRPEASAAYDRATMALINLLQR